MEVLCDTREAHRICEMRVHVIVRLQSVLDSVSALYTEKLREQCVGALEMSIDDSLQGRRVGNATVEGPRVPGILRCRQAGHENAQTESGEDAGRVLHQGSFEDLILAARVYSRAKDALRLRPHLSWLVRDKNGEDRKAGGRRRFGLQRIWRVRQGSTPFAASLRAAMRLRTAATQPLA